MSDNAVCADDPEQAIVDRRDSPRRTLTAPAIGQNPQAMAPASIPKRGHHRRYAVKDAGKGLATGVGKRAGFALMELLTVFALLAIALQIAIPAMATRVAAHRGDAAMKSIAALLSYARLEAQLRGESVTICATDRDGTCQRLWDIAGEIRVFLDADGDRGFDAAEEMLRQLRWPMEDGILEWRASFARAFIAFEPDGGTWQNGTLLYCPASGDARQARALVLGQSGRTYLSEDRDGDGVHEDRQGAPLDC